MKIQLKRSNVIESGSAKEPTSEQMEYGELAVNYNTNDPSLFIKDSADNIVKIADTTLPGDGTITIKQPGSPDQSFTVNQYGNTEINLKNDNTQVTPGNGALSIASFGSGDISTGSYTANQTAGSTVTLPQISYSDLKNIPPAAAAPGNGTITIKQPGTTDQTFTVNQTGNTTIALKNDNTVVTPGNGALTIKTAGEGANAAGTFTANQSAGSTLTLPTIRYGDLSGRPSIPAAAGNGTITIVQPGTVNQTFTVNQSGNKIITLKNDNTVPSVGNGTITITQPGINNQTFTVNQSGNTTIALKNDNTNTTYSAGSGLGLSGTTFSVNNTVVRTSGNQSIGGAKTFTSSLTVSGAITASGDVTAFSDISLKENIEVIPDALNKLSQLRGVTYNRKDMKGERQSGVIAQEVEAVFPEVVRTNEDGIKSVAYGNLVGLLIESIKELKAEVETLKEEQN
jgi:hypothetical protein